MLSFSIWQLIVLAACVVLGYGACSWLGKRDAEVKARRHKAIDIAQWLSNHGMVWTPKILTAYGTGAYKECLQIIHDLWTAVSNGMPALEKEFEAVFKKEFDAKLATPEGLAWVQAEIAAVAAAAMKVAAAVAPVAIAAVV